jgi:hypothetical protein
MFVFLVFAGPIVLVEVSWLRVSRHMQVLTFFCASANLCVNRSSRYIFDLPRKSGSATRWCCAKSTNLFASLTHRTLRMMNPGFLQRRCIVRPSTHEYPERSTTDTELTDVLEDIESLGDDERWLFRLPRDVREVTRDEDDDTNEGTSVSAGGGGECSHEGWRSCF